MQLICIYEKKVVPLQREMSINVINGICYEKK